MSEEKELRLKALRVLNNYFIYEGKFGCLTDRQVKLVLDAMVEFHDFKQPVESGDAVAFAKWVDDQVLFIKDTGEMQKTYEELYEQFKESNQPQPLTEKKYSEGEVYYSYRDVNGESMHSHCSVKEAQDIIGDLMTKYCKLLNVINEL